MGLTLVFTESATLTASTPATATVTVSGTPPNATVNVSYDQPATVEVSTGLPGPGATVSVGTVTTLNADSPATVTNSGSTTNAVFDFGIPQGIPGIQGVQGIPGLAATVSVGSTATLPAGYNATVTNSGTSSAAVLNFSIPRGEPGSSGSAATIALGSVNTGSPGSSVIITNSGNPSAAIFNFTIPRGDTGQTGQTGQTGPQGIQGIPGPIGPTGVVYATAPLSYNSGTQSLSIDLSAYATQSWATSHFYPSSSNPAGYITSSALSGYATQTWVTSQGYLLPASLSGYATQSWVGAQGFITATYLSPYLLSSTAASTYAIIAASVPVGGTTGQVLAKSSATDYALTWVTPSSGGGAAWGSITGTLSSQTDLQTALNGKYSTSNPAGYITSSALSPYLLSSTASTTYAPIAAKVPTGGSTGQVLTKSSGTDYATSWTTPAVGDKYYTTSTTTLSVSNGSKTLTVATGLSYTTQQDIIIAYDSAHHMHAVVTSYNPTTGILVADVAQHTGTGTFSLWTVNVGGISSVAEWGLITGTLSNQTDLQSALDAKLDVTTAASTYQTIAGMSDYLTTASASSTYYPLSNPDNYIPDAPNDGNTYLRQSAAWTQLNII